MQKYTDVVQDRKGNVVIGAAVRVKKPDGSDAALFSVANGTGAISNPLITDNLGRFSFYAANGRYNLQVFQAGALFTTVNDILLEDPLDGSPEVIDGGTFRNGALVNVTIDGLPAANAQDVYELTGREKAVDYAGTLVIARYTQTVRVGGVVYQPRASTVLPFTTTNWGADAAKFFQAGDPAMRVELAGPDGTKQVGRGAQTLEASLLDMMREQNDYGLLTMLNDIGNVDRLLAGIAAGAVTIVVCGDSIMEGNSQILYEDSSIGILRRALIQQNPGITFNIINYGIAGTTMAALANINYKGGAPGVDPNVGFYRAPGGEADNAWPTGSVLNKAWIDHARDAAPHLLIVAFGANDVTGDSYAFAGNLRTVVDYSKLWTNPPSIAVVPCALPSKKHVIGIPLQVPLQKNADAARGIARELNLTVLDVNRRLLLVREGVDISDKKYNVENGWGAYPTGWEITGTWVFTTPGVVLSGFGRLKRLLNSEDIHLAATFVFVNYATGVPSIFYRNTGGAVGYTVQLVNGNTIQLYYNTTFITDKPLGFTVANSAAVTIEARCEGAKHMIYVNGIFQFAVWDYRELGVGQHGVNIEGSTGTNAAVYGLTVRLGNRYKVGTPQMDDDDIYGIDDWTTNPNSDGGNAINHHSKKGGLNVWAPAFAPLLHVVKRSIDNMRARTVRVKAVNTTTAFDATPAQFLAVRIDSVAGQTACVVVVAANTSAIANAEACMRVQGGRTVVVDVVLTVTGTILPANLVLPEGWWSVRATCNLSRNASGYNNNLSVEAVQTY